MGNDVEKGSFIEERPLPPGKTHKAEYWSGSFFTPNTNRFQRLALLQNQSTNAEILGYRDARLREIVFVLSEWFPLPLLDPIVPKLIIENRIVGEELVCKFLGYLELGLRQRGLCIRQFVLDQINSAFNTNIQKRSIFKWFWFYQRVNNVSVENIDVVKKLAAEEIITSSESLCIKKQALNLVSDIIYLCKAKKIVIWDPEIYGYAVTRICLDQIGQKHNNSNLMLRKAISRAVSRLKNQLKVPRNCID